MRVIAVIVILLGIASLVFGVLFVTQAAEAKQEVADSIDPLPLDQLEDKYNEAKAGIEQMEAAGMEPDLGTKLQKTGLGLARTNKGTAQSVMYNGIVDIVLGAGLVLAGLALAKKSGD